MTQPSHSPPNMNANDAKLNSRTITTIIFVSGMLLTGSANTIFTKWQDKACVANCESKETAVNYEQPVWQSLQMFIGEFLCYVVYYLYERRRVKRLPTRRAVAAAYSGNTHDNGNDGSKDALLSNSEKKYENGTVGGDSGWGDEIAEDDLTMVVKKPLRGSANFLLSLPTICDLIATTLMNVGLLVISASIYQMLRGAVVIFTGFFSILFLKTRIVPSRIAALFIVLIGVIVVGSSSVLFPDEKASTDHLADTTASSAFIGVGLIIGAQLFSASQFVIEEKIVNSYSASPLKLVGLEGFFGIISVTLFMAIMHFSYGQFQLEQRNNFFNVVIGWEQFTSNPQVWATSIASALSIAFFNYFGLNITRYISATSRSTIDTCRTIFIWSFGLLLHWETFKWLQIIGFLILIYGTFVFNRIIPLAPGMKIDKN